MSILKGHTKEQARREDARRFVASPVYSHRYYFMDVMKRWLEARTSNDRLPFGAGCNLDTSLRRLLRFLNINPPAGCSYISHSIRSAAFTKSCLLGYVNIGMLEMQ